MASHTCEGRNGPAYAFGLTTLSLAATAVDRAGNKAAGSTSFTVRVSFESLANLTRRWVIQEGIAHGLTTKLEAARTAGASEAKAKALSAYRNQVSAQSGKSLTSEQADQLIQFSGQL